MENAIFKANIQGFKEGSGDELQELEGELYLPMPLSKLAALLGLYGADMSFESYVWAGLGERDVSCSVKAFLQACLPLYGDIYGLNRVAQWLYNLGTAGRKGLLPTARGNGKQALGRTVKEVFDGGIK